jgi:four helix bundle protein
MAKEWDLRERTMSFAVDVFRFCRTLPRTDEARDVARQLRRSASSVAANYRAMRRAPSDPVFLAKNATVIEEADESGFWLELLVEVELVPRKVVAALLTESNELVAIFVASRKNTQARVAREAEEKVAQQTEAVKGRGQSKASDF